MVISGLINILSIILIIDSFQNYVILFENNHYVLKITQIYAQDNGDIFEDSYIFPNFEDGSSFDDAYIFPPFEDSDNVEDRGKDDDHDIDGSDSSNGDGGSSIDDDSGSSDGSSIDDDSGSSDGSSIDDDSSGGGDSGGSSIDDDSSGGGGDAEDRGNEEKINGTTNDFSPLSSRSPNTLNKANLDNKVNQTIAQQPEQDVEDAFQVKQDIGQQPLNQTVGNEVNQTAEGEEEEQQQQQQQDIGQQSELQNLSRL